MSRRSLRFSLLFLPLAFSGLSVLGAWAATDLEPIVVRQSPYGSAGENTVTAVMTKEEIKKIPANSPQDLLGYLGVDVQARGYYGVKSDVSLNASTFQQTLILVNGARVNDSQTAHQDLDLFFSINDIERIEIIPAAQSAKYGLNGIGGAINFVLKKPDRPKGSFSAAGGNNATHEENLDMTYAFLKSKNRLSISDSQSNGTRYDTGYRTDTFFHSTALEGDNNSLYVDLGYNNKEFGAFDYYTPGRGFPSKEWINTTFVDVRSILKNEKFTFEPRLNFREHHDKFMLSITNPGLFLSHHTTDTYQAGGRLSHLFGGGEFGAGADYGEERIVSDTLGDHDRGHWDVYADPTFDLTSNLTLSPVARVDDYENFDPQATGSLSLKRAFEDQSNIYATIGRTARIPTFTELYYSDPTTAGDSTLKPEQAYNFETGWNKQLRRDFSVSLSFFVRQEYDTIDFTKLAASDPKFIARNLKQATTHGINTFFKWQAAEKTSFDLRYFYANRRMDSGNQIFKYGLNFLKHMVDLGMDHQFSLFRNRIDIVFKKKPDRSAWTYVNDRFSYNPRENLELFFEVYNLGNIKFEEIVGIPEQGRLLKIGAKVTW